MTSEEQIRKDVEGSDGAQLELLSRHLAGGVEEYHRKPVRIASL
jgi:hypothetical protein